MKHKTVTGLHHFWTLNTNNQSMNPVDTTLESCHIQRSTHTEEVP